MMPEWLRAIMHSKAPSHVHWMVMICVILMSTACGPVDETESVASDSPQAFELRRVEVGLAFDEPVVVQGSSGHSDFIEETGVRLEPVGDALTFEASLRTADRAGNETQLRIELTIGEERER